MSLVALPSHLPWLVVASPLFAPPPPLDAPSPASQRAVASPCTGTTTSCLTLVRNTPPAPRRLFFSDAGRQQMRGRRWEQCLVFGWLVCCELPPPLLHKKVSHKPHYCKHAKLILGLNANTNTNTNLRYCANSGTAQLRSIQLWATTSQKRKRVSTGLFSKNVKT